MTDHTNPDLTKARYNFKITLESTSPDLPGFNVSTVQNYDGMTFATYTVMKTASVDLLRELATKLWVVAGTEGDIPSTQLSQILADPKAWLLSNS